MSKRKEPDSGCSPLDNRLTRSRSSPMVNESSFEIEALNDSNSADSAKKSLTRVDPGQTRFEKTSTRVNPGQIFKARVMTRLVQIGWVGPGLEPYHLMTAMRLGALFSATTRRRQKRAELCVSSFFFYDFYVQYFMVVYRQYKGTNINDSSSSTIGLIQFLK